MSTGPTSGTIAALYGPTNGQIDQAEYTMLVTVVILSAVVPTLSATTSDGPEGRDHHDGHGGSRGPPRSERNVVRELSLSRSVRVHDPQLRNGDSIHDRRALEHEAAVGQPDGKPSSTAERQQ
jgi:hypothetical protein